MTLGYRLRKAREKKKLLQKDVASELGISHNTISQYETDVRNPDPETLAKLADIYEVTTDYLLGRSDDPTPNINQIDDDTSQNNKVDLANKKIEPTYKGRKLTTEQIVKLRQYIQYVLLNDEDIDNDEKRD